MSIRAPAGATRRRIDFIRHDSSSRTPSGHRVRGRHPDRAALSPIPCYQRNSCSAALPRACEPAEILLINEHARRQQGAEQIAERQKAQDPDILEPMLAGAVNVQGVALSADAIDPKLAAAKPLVAEHETGACLAGFEPRARTPLTGANR